MSTPEEVEKVLAFTHVEKRARVRAAIANALCETYSYKHAASVLGVSITRVRQLAERYL